MKRLFSFLVAIVLLTTTVANSLYLTVAADSPNLISNPSAEAIVSGQPTGWTANTWGTSSTTLQLTSNAHSGSEALSITSTARTSGDAKWVPDAVAVTGGQQYTYSDFYQASVPTELDAEYIDASGAVSYGYITATAAASSWQQANATFTVPASATKVAVMHILATAGNLIIDDASLSSAATTPVTPPAAGNLIANPSFETANGSLPANWQNGSWGTNDASFSYDQTGHTGSKSARVTITSYTSGDAKWYANPAAITAGQAYTYSDFYTASVATHVVAAYTSTDDTTAYAELPLAAATSTWTNYTATFTAPANAKSVTLYHLLSALGSLSLDDVSLVTSTTTPPPQSTPLAIANPSVETSSDGTTPDSWIPSSWGTNDASFSYSSDAHTGNKSVKAVIGSYTDGDAKWYFNPVTGLKDGDSYHFSAWIKASTQVHAVAAFTMKDGSTSYETLALPLGVTSTNWTQYTSSFTAPTGAQDATVYLLISNAGWVETDDYNLTTYNPTGFSEGLVSIDFDDGWKNIYTNGLPLLQKYGLPSTQYIISGNIGTTGYMTKAQIKAFQTQGSEIGSHTVDHADLTTLTAAQLNTELSQSQATLRSNFGSSVASEFATPYGSYNDTVLTAVKKYYVSHRSTDVGFNSKDNFNPYNIVVQNVTATTTVAQVKAWVQQAQTQKTWLVLVYHQVENTIAAGDTDAVKTANLNTELSYIKTSGIAVKTQAAAFAEVTAQLQ